MTTSLNSIAMELRPPVAVALSSGLGLMAVMRGAAAVWATAAGIAHGSIRHTMAATAAQDRTEARVRDRAKREEARQDPKVGAMGCAP
ncbi:MAG: hypothetical protein ACTS3F_12775, partial [Phycisphaerales bacterium]